MKRSSTTTGRKRLGVVGAIGVGVAFGASWFTPWELAALAGWVVAAAAFISWVWLTVARLSPEQTRLVATIEDNSRIATSTTLLLASTASLVGAGLSVLRINDTSPNERTALLVAGVATVALSWGVVQTVFALRYAHEYYTEPVGGIDFGDVDGEPDYQDFAYVAFTVGMTFQTSDTTIQTRKIRRTVLTHALMAYLFGAVILAVMVNVIGGLVN
jgi:uncharacterized membrane protein